MYWITESAGRTGSFFVIIGSGILLGMTAHGWQRKMTTTLRILLALIIVLSAFAWLNEHMIKDVLRIARPSHTYIMTQTKSKTSIDSVYSLVIDGRRTFLRNLVDRDTITFKNIDPRIVNHWVQEAGYSFPSGHSFNAFLMASLVAFSIFQYGGYTITLWSTLPLVWAAFVAYSRVAIGAHTPVDVTAGAALGIIVSHTLLAIPLTRKLLTIPERGSDIEGP